MLTMRYPVVRLGQARLGQITDLEIDTLWSNLRTAQNIYRSLPSDIGDAFEGDLKDCSEIVSWASATRTVKDYFDADSCVKLVRYELEQAAQAQYTVEDPQADAGPQLAPTTSALQERVKSEVEGLAVWPWVGVAAGLAIFGGVIWAATR